MSRFLTSEQFFLHQDLFVRYVAEQVNPARASEGLDTISDGAARHLFQVMDEGRYTFPAQPTQSQAGSARLTCLRCDDGNTGLYCLNCAKVMT